MKRFHCIMLIAGAIVTCLMFPNITRAEQFKIAIMQDQQGVAAKYKPLLVYLAKKGVEASFVATKDYPAAAQLFAAGQADAMFSGSGIAGTMIIKGLAEPEVRPVGNDGHSTYWAVVIAPKGVPSFTGSADLFKGKRVIMTGLASAGEFYFHSIPGYKESGAQILKAASHGAAIDALDKGQADFAIVKNRVWDENKYKYPNLVKIGEDKGENPDDTMIVSKKADKGSVSKVVSALLGLKEDTSAEATAAKNSLAITGYIKTTTKDFGHTISLLRAAGVTKEFAFRY
ncbi:MAG: PhnD/SsuA/transferrin family substrate-binding protein [Nitrospirota bacterium]|nr:PhnD/SsuA/transferrin family substrate-binding protein [Nitrospirota bacterium]